jgi:hypothetical protein
MRRDRLVGVERIKGSYVRVIGSSDLPRDREHKHVAIRYAKDSKKEGIGINGI